MNNPNAAAAYQNEQFENAPPLKILQMLNEGAIRFMRQASAFQEAGDTANRGRVLGRAHAIVSELQATLDHDHAPELCEELDRLYDFVLYQITESNIRADASLLQPAIEVMGTLEDAWTQLAGRG